MANTNKHFLVRELSTFTSGVAWDFICSQLNPITYNETTSNAQAIDVLNDVALTTCKPGAFQKFYSLYMDAMNDVQEIGGLNFSAKYIKSLLISKLPKEYTPMRISTVTNSPFEQYVMDLQAFAATIKKVNKSYKDALISNTNSTNDDNAEGSDKSKLDTILC